MGLLLFWGIYRAFVREAPRSSLEVTLCVPVSLAGASYVTGQFAANLILFPFLVLLVFRLSPLRVALVALILPAVNAGWLVGPRADEAGSFLQWTLLCSAGITALCAGLLLRRVTREKSEAERALSSIRTRVREGEASGAFISEEAVIAGYEAKKEETDGEIMAVLHAAKAAFVADSVAFFEAGEGAARCRLSTDPAVSVTGGGVIASVAQGEPGIVATEIKGNGRDPGYIRSEEFDSLAAVPVIDEGRTTGVLAMDSDRHRAFIGTDLERLGFFASAIALILRSARAHDMISREHAALKALKDEAQQLLSTLDMGELSGVIVEGMHRTCGEPVMLFLRGAGKGTYTLVESRDVPLPAKRDFSLAGTLLNIPVTNRQKLFLGDLSSYRGKVLPFRYDGLSSILCLPLVLGTEVKGVIAAVSARRDAFAFQDNLHVDQILELFRTMVSMSVANAMNHEKISRLSRTDGLTGLFNRRYFQECVERECKRAKRNPAPFSLVLLDIDFFKKVNDTFGHPAGDEVLRGVAGKIRGRIRETDIAARYGGEEFAVLLTDSDSRGARIFCEDLRRDIERTEFPVGEGLRVTVSLGVASVPHDAASKEELVQMADRMLYASKEQGRNRTSIWSEEASR